MIIFFIKYNSNYIIFIIVIMFVMFVFYIISNIFFYFIRIKLLVNRNILRMVILVSFEFGNYFFIIYSNKYFFIKFVSFFNEFVIFRLNIYSNKIM